MSLCFPPPLCNRGDTKSKEDGGIGWRRDTSLWASPGRFSEEKISTVPFSAKGKDGFWREMHSGDGMGRVQRRSVNMNVKLKITGSISRKVTRMFWVVSCSLSVELISKTPVRKIQYFVITIIWAR